MLAWIDRLKHPIPAVRVTLLKMFARVHEANTTNILITRCRVPTTLTALAQNDQSVVVQDLATNLTLVIRSPKAGEYTADNTGWKFTPRFGAYRVRRERTK